MPMDVCESANPGALAFRKFARVRLHRFERIREDVCPVGHRLDMPITNGLHRSEIRGIAAFPKVPHFAKEPRLDHLLGAAIDAFLEHLPARIDREVEHTKGAVLEAVGLAHIGGALYGYLAVKRKWIFRDPLEQVDAWRASADQKRAAGDSRRMDALLDRIQKEGMSKLSEGERDFLRRMSKRGR